jgi:hypothetical protein
LLGRELRQNIENEKITNMLKIIKMAAVICDSQKRWKRCVVIKHLKSGPFEFNQEEKQTFVVGELPFKIPKKFS